ncbi:hypothetical protein SAMN05192541_13120 [Bradyrhizobium arachidis]|uniref:Uncharacterized protein n=1 Tax=Bradyrhizobium arachidis TaxID=858423 RepID=A0AAE7NWV4_9BRAD|nr:hypothetical protein WN72_39815 [Bradyrhizobium arachidis]SFV17918.1 hypothetical protein SAMN05192541_13120 [Bradyrhizobium arachidis]
MPDRVCLDDHDPYLGMKRSPALGGYGGLGGGAAQASHRRRCRPADSSFDHVEEFLCVWRRQTDSISTGKSEVGHTAQ